MIIDSKSLLFQNQNDFENVWWENCPKVAFSSGTQNFQDWYLRLWGQTKRLAFEGLAAFLCLANAGKSAYEWVMYLLQFFEGGPSKTQ